MDRAGERGVGIESDRPSFPSLLGTVATTTTSKLRRQAKPKNVPFPQGPFANWLSRVTPKPGSAIFPCQKSKRQELVTAGVDDTLLMCCEAEFG